MVRAAVLAGIGVGALAMAVLAGEGADVDAVLLGLGIMAGEALVLHPAGGPRVPASHAVVLVALRVLPWATLVIVCVLAFTLAAWAADGLRTRGGRWNLGVRIGTAVAAGCSYYAVLALAPAETTRWVLAALSAAAASQMAIDELVARLRHGFGGSGKTWSTRGRPEAVGSRSHLWPRGRAAALAVASSGVLMSLVSSGAEGRPGPGRWSCVLLAVPLVAAWAADSMAGRARRNYLQTVDALAATPELGGHVPTGSTERVATLSRRVGESLDLDLRAMEDLEAAARLHRLGSVCLAPAPAGSSTPRPRRSRSWMGTSGHTRDSESARVADMTAHILAGGDRLDRVGTVVAAAARPHRRTRSSEKGPRTTEDAERATEPPGAGVLRVVSTYEDLTGGDDGRAVLALERMYTGPAYMFDPGALAALEIVLSENGLLDAGPRSEDGEV